MIIQRIDNISSSILNSEKHPRSIDLKTTNHISPLTGNDNQAEKADSGLPTNKVKFDTMSKNIDNSNERVLQKENIEKMKVRIEALIENQQKSFKAIKDLLYLITPGMESFLENESKKI